MTRVLHVLTCSRMKPNSASAKVISHAGDTLGWGAGRRGPRTDPLPHAQPYQVLCLCAACFNHTSCAPAACFRWGLATVYSTTDGNGALLLCTAPQTENAGQGRLRGLICIALLLLHPLLPLHRSDPPRPGACRRDRQHVRARQPGRQRVGALRCLVFPPQLHTQRM